MAEWPYASKTEVHFGSRPAGSSDPEQIADYGTDKGEAAQAATMPGFELVQFEVTTGPVAVIHDPLDDGAATKPYREPGDPPGPRGEQ